LYEKKIALIGALLIVISPIQYTAYVFILWKNMWAIVLMLTAFIFIKKELFIETFITEILLALSHKTTAIIYTAVLGLMLISNWRRFKEFIFHIIVTILCFTLVNPSINSSIRFPPIGVFIELDRYILLSLPIIILALYGVFIFIKNKKLPGLWGFIIISLIFPIFRLPFYQRILIFTDISMIMLAAYGLNNLADKINYQKDFVKSITIFIILCIFFGTLVGNLYSQIITNKPIISSENLIKIESETRNLPENITVLTSTDEAPWMEGWSHVHIAAPGMLHDNHNLDEWVSFWSSTSSSDKINFLSKLPQPLYIVTSKNITDLIGKLPDCIILLSNNIFFNNCKKI
jgi:hypothetical protein